MITENDCYKAVSELINECYDWLTDKDHNGRTQYILGLNDMARYLAQKIVESPESG